MKIQLLSDLHLETEAFDPAPTPGAQVLVLAGDIDTTWKAYSRFAHWPVPVLVVPGNHEFDGRDLQQALPALRALCESLSFKLLYRESLILQDSQGLRVRFVGATRWSDFDLFGAARREKAMRAAAYFLKYMNASLAGQPLDAAALREEGLACRQWLEQTLALPAGAKQGGWDRTVVITHFTPSLRSADPRFGAAPGTASFCNADDDLIERCDLWLHGHVHARHDYSVARGVQRPARVVCQARGLAKKGETLGFEAEKLIELR